MTFTNVVDVPLKNYLVATALKPERYSATSLFTPFETEKDDVLLIDWDKANKAGQLHQVESNGDAESVTVKFEFTSSGVKSKVISVRSFISDKDKRNATDPIASILDKAIISNLMKILITYRENDAAALAQNASNYGTNTEALVGTAQWSDPASTPYTDLSRWSSAVSDQAEADTNFVFLAKDVFSELANHQDTIDRLKTINEKVLTPDALIRLLTNKIDLNPEQIVIGRSSYNTSKTGTKTQVPFWSKTAILAYQNPNAKNMMLQKTFGQMFYPKGFNAIKIYKYTKDELRGGYYIEVEIAYCFKIIAQDCGFLGTAVIA